MKWFHRIGEGFFIFIAALLLASGAAWLIAVLAGAA